MKSLTRDFGVILQMWNEMKLPGFSVEREARVALVSPMGLEEATLDVPVELAVKERVRGRG